jgi:phosphohistidine swiveling domain-containing protein
MSDDYITRPEFKIFMRTVSDSNERMAATMESISESQKHLADESRKTNEYLKQYTIHNNHRHEKNEDQILLVNKTLEDFHKQFDKIEEAVTANARVAAAARNIKWAAVVVLTGALSSVGSVKMKEFLDTRAVNPPPAITQPKKSSN